MRLPLLHLRHNLSCSFREVYCYRGLALVPLSLDLDREKNVLAELGYSSVTFLLGVDG